MSNFNDWRSPIGQIIPYKRKWPVVIAPDVYDAFCLAWQYIGRVHRDVHESSSALARAATPRFLLEVGE
jgi:hypothetical protein